MRALLPEPAENVDVHEVYANGWSGSGGLRVNFVASVDGAATVEQRSAGLQTPGDHRVFDALRDLADVILAGAGTVRAERYAAVDPSPARRARRRRLGMPDALPTAVVSRSLGLNPAAPLFAEAPAAERTIVITCAAADADARRGLAEVADVIVCGEDEVDLVTARAELEARGLTRILCEGGPSLFADAARAGIVDEVCLSLSPILAGPGAGRIVAGVPWTEGPLDLRMVGLLEDDGALFLRLRASR